MKLSILFFGSSENSAIIRQALVNSDYQLVNKLQAADIIIVADYGEKIPQKWLNSVKFGGLNLHPSLLPNYRGATPVPYQILNGEKQGGISIIQMTNRLDAGPILTQETIPIYPDDTTPFLLERSFTAGAKLLIRILPDYLNNKITLKKQDESLATYTRKFTKTDGFISWKEFKKSPLSLELDRKIRALFPWPSVWTKMPNGKILKLLPGKKVQLEAKNPISFKQFLAGYQRFLN